MPANAPQPLVSIVTPSLDQGRFIDSAIDSVLAQTYPHIEYLVIDGGSKDETLEILESYGDRIRWSSGPDGGQSDAIHTGFSRASGDILAWLNADDVYEPDAVATAVAAFRRNPAIGLVYGPGHIIDTDGETVSDFRGHEPFNLWRLIHVLDYILQPTTFFRRGCYFQAGGLDTSLHWTMDWDLWLRLAAISEIECQPQYLAKSREYEDTKTAAGGWRRIAEIGRVARRRAHRFWTPGVRLYALDTLRQQCLGLAPRLAHLINSIIARLSRQIIEGVGVHADGWHGPRSAIVLPADHRTLELEIEVLRIPATGPLVVDIALDSRPLESISIEQTGTSTHQFPLPPAGIAAFRQIDLDRSISFRGGGDRRRLTFRCLAIRSHP